MTGFTERELALRLMALAALLRAMKWTKKATQRCRKRRERAIVGLLEMPLPMPAKVKPDPEEAITFLRRSCRVCGKCKGV